MARENRSKQPRQCRPCCLAWAFSWRLGCQRLHQHISCSLPNFRDVSHFIPPLKNMQNSYPDGGILTLASSSDSDEVLTQPSYDQPLCPSCSDLDLGMLAISSTIARSKLKFNHFFIYIMIKSIKKRFLVLKGIAHHDSLQS